MYRLKSGSHLSALMLGLGLLSACGGSSSDRDHGGGGGGDTTTRTGIFVDAPVDGLGYKAGAADAAFTADGGKFTYRNGDTVSFFVGNAQLGSATGAPLLSPRNLASGNAALNIARFLMALDADGLPENGITISPETFASALSLAQPDFASADFDNSDAAAFANAEAIRFGGELPTLAEAEAHLRCSLDGVCPPTRVFQICPSQGATDAALQDQALKAFFEAREGDTIEFCAGQYSFNTGLFLHSKRGITLKGAGKAATILNFDESASSEGINVASSDGIVIEGLTVEDTPGNAIRIFRSNYVTMRDVSTRWSDADPGTAGYQTSPNNGAYGLYPVECRYVLIENSESIGASDAGIYVGQTSDVIVRNTRAEYNVAGFEFENTYRAVFEDNIATNNTGGFLVFDLPGLRQYGQKNIVRRNKSFGNNTENFAPVGNIVGVVPRGTGMLVLATDQLEIYDNEIYDNDTVGLAIVNFGLADPNEPDIKYDFYPEGLTIHDNLFRDNGGNTQEPNPDRGEASVLPLILRLKNLGRGAHIVWDGGVDQPNGCTAIPTDPDSVPLTEPNPNYPHEEQGGRTDERGRPNVSREDSVGNCKWNAWKFNAAGQLKLPENGLCIKNNTFESTQPQTLLTTNFLNAHVTSSDPEQLAQDLLVPGSNDLAPHDCALSWPVPPDPPGMPETDADLGLPFVPDPGSEDARPDPAVLRSLHLPEDGQRYLAPNGCAECQGRGYHGRVPIFEILSVTDGFREGVVRGASQGELTRLAEEGGMQTLWEAGMAKVRQGLTSLDEIARAVRETGAPEVSREARSAEAESYRIASPATPALGAGPAPGIVPPNGVAEIG